MRFGRISKAVGVTAVAAVALSACATQGGGSNTSTASAGAKQGGTVTVVEVNAFNTFNSNTADGNTDINSKISYPTHSGFYYIDNKLNVVHNDKFGKLEKVSDSPLTVKYTVNDGVKWSDGTPVTAYDVALQWAAASGWYDDADPKAKTGTSYFSTAGDTTGLNNTEFPEVSSDGKSMTLKYTKAFADWEIALGSVVDIPSNVVAKHAGLSDGKALYDLMKGIKKGDPSKPQPANETLKKAADFYNTGFDTKTLPSDTSLFLSNGPFIVKDIVPDQSMTLVRNKDYNWGPTPNVDSIVVRYIGSAPAQVQALKNGEADIIAPQASSDTVEQLKAIPGVTVDQGNQLSYDHIDLNFSGPLADKDVRTAFMLTVPRQDIVDKIIKKLDPNAKPLDSQIFVPQQAAYADSVKNNGSADFQQVNIDKAKQLLAGKTPTIRIMYNKDNPNRVDAYTLIAASASKAGFKIVDGGLGKSDWGKALGKGGYDATIFGWINPGVGVSGVPQIFKTGNGSNFNKFSDPAADQLMDQLIQTTDQSKQVDLEKQIDQKIWASSYGLPLFQSVGVDAYSDKVTGVKYMPNQTGVWWNFWEWATK
ncbi:Extracellular solute-binding protein, family 5 [Sinomonas atrocyanea]|uniref:Extracellular solute-binding protein, family 5 n=1 Tax=Sinomonas atrocyanea TaxID=37927 RepID=A0A127A447_9MICC|nr:ABC transporter family substrate-binding protein [Sinomonas atrocyanea]AMM33415.1 Extracellular solute-binding protein, family 5 [Sinomonas atrocyanea]GEB62858.1 peptide ABC transporter substrate-binding protein [Sinomonas atrocyanea]GGG60584.1 peptide ABC transporter substrate-binding protein [Sinomonas atrocyanea]